MEMYFLEEAERRRKEALSNGNSRLFFKLSEELGMSPETQYEKDLYAVGSLEYVSEESTNKEHSKLLSKLKNRATRDRELVDAINFARLNFKSPESSLNEKERILREVLGYERLRTGKGQFTPLEDCKPTRINMMLKKEYNLAIKRMKDDSR